MFEYEKTTGVDIMNPLVSVIVPLYNYEQYITDCIRSIIEQPYPNLELLIVDDCSTDNSYEVAKRFVSSKVQLLKTKSNRGYSAAKNHGIRKSQGELIVTLDADDMLTRKSIGSRVKRLRVTNADFVHAQALTVRGPLSLDSCRRITKFRRLKPVVHAQTVMLKRWIHCKHGLYDENLRSRADKEMWIRLFGEKLRGPRLANICFLDKDVAYYRRHKKSMMADRVRNPKLQKKLTKDLQQAIKMRKEYGITPENTLFLEN